MGSILQSSTYSRPFLLVLASDHISPATGKSPTVTISKACAAFAAVGGAVTEISGGWYKIALTTTDTNTLGALAYHVTEASSDNSDFDDQIVAYDPFTAPVAAPANFSVQVISAQGGVRVDTIQGTTQTGRDVGASVLVSSGTGTGQLQVTSGIVQSDIRKVIGTVIQTGSSSNTTIGY